MKSNIFSVTIVMAIYKPNLGFLKKQLISLNCQSYSNIKLIVCDDSGEKEKYELLLRQMLIDNITSFPYELYFNDYNRGSNKTFEMLTMLADGDYIAYCDQDDIWESNKIEKLIDKIDKSRSVAVYSDLSIIDENDVVIYRSFREINKTVKHKRGEKIYKYLISRYSVTGCTLLINREVAQKAAPFPSGFVHDHWLSIYGSIVGRIDYIKQPLVKYRIHSNNQIGSKKMSNIFCKDDYIKLKLTIEKDRLVEAINKIDFSSDFQKVVLKKIEFLDKRINFLTRMNLTNFIKFIPFIVLDYQFFGFELLLGLSNGDNAKKLIDKIKK